MSTINIYSSNSINQWDLLPNKLFIIDDIADYLLTKTKTTLSDVQYQKNQLELTLKLDMSQAMAQADSVSNYKYLSIQNNSDERIHYYFVRKASWRSQNCVQFDLLLDVLNTFHETTDYVFKPNTKIVREHKDRYVKGLNEIIISVDYFPTKTGNVNEGDHVSLISRFDQKVMFSGTITEISLGFTNVTIEVDGAYFDKLATIKADLASHESSPYSLDVTDDDYLMYSAIIENDFTFNMAEHRVIDYVPEGINPLLYHNPDNDVVIENPKSLLQIDWYLLYRNQNDPSESLTNPVECYLIPESELSVSIGTTTTAQITPATLETGKVYFIPIYCRGITDAYIDFPAYDQSLTLSDGTTISGHSATDEVSYVAVTKNQDNTLNIIYNKLLYDNNAGSARFALTKETIYKNVAYITIDQSPTYYGQTTSNSLTTIEIFEDLLSLLDRESFTYTGTGLTINGIDLLDKTDAKNIKLIKLPYSPYNFTITGNKLNLSLSDWNYVTITQYNGIRINLLQLNNLNTKLSANIDLANTAHPFYAFGSLTLSPLLTLTRNNIYETKIYHSEFYSPTYVYDSFSLNVHLERCNLNYYIEYKAYKNIKFKFDVTRTINSRFMFTLTEYKCKFTDSNFNTIFTIARNNEEVLYNTPYINFIRNGYNYEVKSKQLQNTSNWISAGLGFVGGAGATIFGAISHNPLAVAGGIASMVTSLKGAITSQAQSENSLAQKLDQLKQQTASVAGSDDVDLMSIYAKNRVIYMLYTPNEVMTNMLYDLFFYAGYASGRMGIPNHTRRVNFDYLECEAKIESLATIPEDCLNELISCFATGVTYIHKTSRTSKKWDVKQEYENWEKFLFD